MKIGIFTDPHYSSQTLTCKRRYNSRSLEKIREAYRFFLRERCDLVVCLGDLTDREVSHAQELRNLEALAELIRSQPVETVCLMGNHDAFSFTQEEFYGVLGGCRPENRHLGEKNLIFLDACYFTGGRHYMPGDTDWTDTCYPFVEDLKKQLRQAKGDIYVFVHQNLDPNVRQDHCLSNSEQINELLRSTPGVKAVFQGHYHRGRESLLNGIRYITFPAMCEGEQAYFIESTGDGPLCRGDS